MKKKLFVIFIVLLSVLFPGCLKDIDDDDDANNNEVIYRHIYEMDITPHNLSENASPAYSVGVRFLIPKNDSYYHVNQSHFSRDVKKEIVIENNNSAYLKLSYPDMQVMGFISEYNDFEIYMSIQNGSNYYAHFPNEYLFIWYNGSYEYLEINYFERVELFGAYNDFIKEASCHVKLYDQGWNRFNTSFEQESWIE